MAVLFDTVVVDSNQGRIGQAHQKVGLPLKAFDRIRVLGDVRVNDLDGHHLIGLEVTGHVNGGDAAAANLIVDFVVVLDNSADHGTIPRSVSQSLSSPPVPWSKGPSIHNLDGWAFSPNAQLSLAP